MKRLRAVIGKVRGKGLRWLIERMLFEARTSRIAGILSASFRITRRKRATYPLVAVYDLNFNSPSYNFVQFILCAECYCLEKGIEGYTVVVVPKEMHPSLDWSSFTESYGDDAIAYRSIFLFGTLSALGSRCRGFQLLPSRKELSAALGQRAVYPPSYGLGQTERFEVLLHAELRANGVRCELAVPRHVERLMAQWPILSTGAKIVTITIRHSKFDVVRNSNMPAWLAFADHIKGRGFTPIFIPDSDQPFSNFESQEYIENVGFCAAYHPGIRLFLYKRAFVNFFVPNGPGALVLYSSDIRYIYMKTWLAGSDSSPSSMSGYDFIDQSTGRVFWASAAQYFNGDPDTIENIVANFNSFCAQQEQLSRAGVCDSR